jgi:phosphoribosylformylglycinamidine synthase
MTLWLAKVRVMLKPSVNDPQGLSVRNALRTLAFNVDEVRVGKVIHVQLEATDRAAAEISVDAMCQKLLANPVIEVYDFTLAEAPAPVS